MSGGGNSERGGGAGASRSRGGNCAVQISRPRSFIDERPSLTSPSACLNWARSHEPFTQRESVHTDPEGRVVHVPRTAIPGSFPPACTPDRVPPRSSGPALRLPWGRGKKNDVRYDGTGGPVGNATRGGGEGGAPPRSSQGWRQRRPRRRADDQRGRPGCEERGEGISTRGLTLIRRKGGGGLLPPRPRTGTTSGRTPLGWTEPARRLGRQWPPW